jgi:hypothetical protein
MKKIVSLFARDYDGNRQVFDSIVPGAEWVRAGEGLPTVKIDGTSCHVKDGKLFKRYDVKKDKIPPAGFVPAQDPDPVTGHWPGWLEVGEGPEDKWHREAFVGEFDDGATYELIGPKVQGNPYKKERYELIKHGSWVFDAEPPRTFEELKKWFAENVVEGIVWHRDNGDMVKIKRRDFGLKWPE